MKTLFVIDRRNGWPPAVPGAEFVWLPKHAGSRRYRASSVLPREIEALLRPALPKSGDAAIEVDAYFGRDPTGRHAAVSRRLFELVKAPLLRARFQRIGASWQLNGTAMLDPTAFPCILKKPGSAFSRGVTKVESAAGLRPALERLLGRSDIVIAQEYIPTEFDWRVGVLDRRVAV